MLKKLIYPFTNRYLPFVAGKDAEHGAIIEIDIATCFYCMTCGQKAVYNCGSELFLHDCDEDYYICIACLSSWFIGDTNYEEINSSRVAEFVRKAIDDA